MSERILHRLIRERDAGYSNGIYVPTQLQFAWNSNHMEGSTLTPQQTAQIFATGTFTTDGAERVRVDDAIETRNHFTAFRWMLDHADDPVDRELVCRLHAILKNGTRQADDPLYNVGGYKKEPNVIGNAVTPVRVAAPDDVPRLMDRLFDVYAHLEDDPYQIARAHWMFEKIHPFSDGNGRVGRLVMFKELLRIDAMPVIVHDSFHDRYVANMDRFPEEPGWLVDLLLFERDVYGKRILGPIGECLDYTYNDRWDEHDHADDIRKDVEFKREVEASAEGAGEEPVEDDGLLWGDVRLPWPDPDGHTGPEHGAEGPEAGL